MDIHDHIDLLAADQHGLVTAAQLRGLGFSRRQMTAHSRTRRLEQIAANVFRMPGSPRSWHQQLLAAVWRLGRDAVASHRSALALHALRPSGLIEVTVARSHRRVAPEGIRLHTTEDLRPGDVVVAQGIPTTAPWRTLVDVGCLVGRERLEELLDIAERRRLVDRDELVMHHQEIRRRGRNGVGPMADVLEARLVRGNATPESVLERRFLRLVEDSVLPRPVPQYELERADRRRARADFAYPDRRIAIELEGVEFHASAAALTADADRHNQLQIAADAAGFTLYRFTWTHVTRTPAIVVTTLRAALARAAA